MIRQEVNTCIKRVFLYLIQFPTNQITEQHGNLWYSHFYTKEIATRQWSAREVAFYLLNK